MAYVSSLQRAVLVYFVGHSAHKMTVVNKKFMFQHVYDSPPASVFDRVGVLLRELLRVRYGYCSQALFSNDEMDFIVCFCVCSNVYISFSSFYYCVLLYDFHIK